MASISGVELRSILSTGLCRRIDPERQYEITYVPAIELIDSRRLDIAAKLYYVEDVLRDIRSEWARKLYLAHIKAFNGFYESDGSGKLGGETFISTFEGLIATIEQDGWRGNSMVPVSEEGVVLDGAHRVAIACALGITVPTVTLSGLSPRYDYVYFQSRRLRDQYLDFMVMQYVLRKPHVHVLFAWPVAEPRIASVERILQQYCTVSYKKMLRLSSHGPVNIMRLVYKAEPWLGEASDGFPGARNKAAWCFGKHDTVRLYFIENVRDVIVLKEQIRDLFSLGKHSIHINDTQAETIEIVHTCLNENGLHWLDYARPRTYQWFERLLNHYRNWLEKSGFNQETFCLDGSAVLAAYGARDVRDLDYVALGDFHTGFPEIENHNSEVVALNISPESIICDPQQHFYYRGLKCVSLAHIEERKRRRAEPKDIADIEMIRSLCDRRPMQIRPAERVARVVNVRFVRGYAKLVAFRVRYLLRVAFRKVRFGRR